MPRALASTIADVLKSRIEAGEWADARLPPERELASDFGVARNTELLKALHLLLKGLRNQAPWFEMKQRSFSEQRRLRYCEEHASILAALVRRDPAGSRDAMAAHLTTVRVNMMGR